MTAPEVPAGARTAAESAEMRKAATDRPKVQARRGLAAGRGHGMNCGRTVEEVRKLTDPCPSVPFLPDLAPRLVRMGRPEPREVSPPRPLTRRDGSWPLIAAEPEPGEAAERPALARLLTHPTFDRPKVANPRRRGPMGAITLHAERQRREREAREAQQRRPPHDVASELLQAAPARAGGDRAAALVGDDAVIAEALARLDVTLRRPGAFMDSPERVRAFVTLHMAGLEREEFRALFLDGQHAVIAFESFGLGTLTQASVYPRELVRRALVLNAGAVVLVHNHPSGLPEPSRADELLTQAIKTALALVDVRVLDHFIVGRLQVVSLAERGLV